MQTILRFGDYLFKPFCDCAPFDGHGFLSFEKAIEVKVCKQSVAPSVEKARTEAVCKKMQAVFADRLGSLSFIEYKFLATSFDQVVHQVLNLYNKHF